MEFREELRRQALGLRGNLPDIAGLGKSEKLPNIDKMYCLTTLNCCCFIITSGLATHISPKTVLDVII